MWFRLGAETRIDLQRCAAAPVPQSEAAGIRGGGAEDGAAGPSLCRLMAAMAGGALFFMVATGGGERVQSGLRSAAFVTGSADLEPAIEACLSTPHAPGRAVAATDPGQPLLAGDGVPRHRPGRGARRAGGPRGGRFASFSPTRSFWRARTATSMASRTLRRMENVFAGRPGQLPYPDRNTLRSRSSRDQRVAVTWRPGIDAGHGQPRHRFKALRGARTVFQRRHAGKDRRRLRDPVGCQEAEQRAGLDIHSRASV